MRLEPDNFIKRGSEAGLEGVGFSWGCTRLPSWKRYIAGLAARSDGRSTRTPRARGCEDNNGLHASGDGRRCPVAGELGAILDKEFFAQGLPKLPPEKRPPNLYRKPFRILEILVAGAGFEPATFGL